MLELLANTSRLSEEEVENFADKISQEIGLPMVDPLWTYFSGIKFEKTLMAIQVHINRESWPLESEIGISRGSRKYQRS